MIRTATADDVPVSLRCTCTRGSGCMPGSCPTTTWTAWTYPAGQPSWRAGSARCPVRHRPHAERHRSRWRSARIRQRWTLPGPGRTRRRTGMGRDLCDLRPPGPMGYRRRPQQL